MVNHVKIVKLTVPRFFSTLQIETYLDSNKDVIENEFVKMIGKEQSCGERAGEHRYNLKDQKPLKQLRYEKLVKSRPGMKISHNFICPFCLKDRYYGYSYIENNKEIEICSQCYLSLRNPDPYLKYIPVNFEGDKSKH